MRDRGKLDITMANMFSGAAFTNYIFWATMIGQCSVKLTDDLPAVAGVAFSTDHYVLYLHNTDFFELPLEEQLGVLCHEMSHIYYGHVGRAEDRNREQWNIATDTAINQLINRKHLPSWGCFKDNFPVQPCKAKESSEYYYSLLEKSGEGKDKTKEGGPGSPGESGEPGSPGTHTTWDESIGDEALIKVITKQMLDRSIAETVRSRGSLPSDISSVLALHKTKALIQWKKALLGIVGNKKVNKRRSIMKEDRRFPDRDDLKGTVKDRMFDLVVVIDVSGSHSAEPIIKAMNEIKHICDITKSKLKLIQVDTKVHKVEDFDSNTKIFNRAGCGGTRMEPAIDYIREERIKHDAIILITDGEIEDISTWSNPPKCRMIFLTTKVNIPGIESYRQYRQFNIKDA